MEKDSALYQLMDTRMNGVMNGIVSGDGEYQAILRKSDIYSGELDRMDLSKEIPQSHVLRELPNRTERLRHSPSALSLFFFPAFHAFQTVFQEPTVAVDVPFRCFGIIRSGENIPDISHIRSGKEAGTGFPDSGIWS